MTVQWIPVLIVGCLLQAQAQQPSRIELETGAKLLSIRRVYVESPGNDQAARVMQSMIINSLVQTGTFIVTENRDKADAVLKGAFVQKTSQELHATSEGTSVAAVVGGGSASAGPLGGSARSGIAGAGAGIQDASASTETIDHAALSVRLVSNDGDTIWSTTQESTGAKYKGAGADVADKIVKQLLRDLEKVRKLVSAK